MTNVNHPDPALPPGGIYAPAVRRESPAFPSTAYLAVGLVFLFLAGFTFASGTFDSGVRGGGYLAVLVIAAAFGISGQIMVAIGVIAKGVKLGNRES